MTRLLMSSEKPSGETLELVLATLIHDIEWKTQKLQRAFYDAPYDATTEGDVKCIVRHEVMENNKKIVELLGQALGLQVTSTQKLDALAPNQGPTGTPRI